MVLKGVMFLAISLWQNCEKRQHFLHSWKIAQEDKNNSFHYLAFTILRNQTNYMESLIHLHHTNMVRCSASSPKRGNYNRSRYEHIYVLRISCTWRPQRLFTFAMVPSHVKKTLYAHMWLGIFYHQLSLLLDWSKFLINQNKSKILRTL